MFVVFLVFLFFLSCFRKNSGINQRLACFGVCSTLSFLFVSPGAGTVCVGTPPHGANARSERRDAFRVTALESVKTSGGSRGVGGGSYCSRGSGRGGGGVGVMSGCEMCVAMATSIHRRSASQKKTNSS